MCVGPRSAVFAPLDDIGLIVVDEEHESSYKHEGDPRYDARTVACERAARHGAVVVFGSATPRPESVLAMERLRLAERVDRRPHARGRGARHARPPPAASPRDADGARRPAPRRRQGDPAAQPPRLVQLSLLPRLRAGVAVPQLRRRARPASPRRSSSPATTAATASGCPSRCGACASVSVARHGAGTERIEHELREALGGTAFRSSASTPTPRALPERARTLQRFQAAPAGVLVGTQMVAKGHDFPDVSLGVVLDADQTLRFPDFRAEERTFALITQLAGRDGPGRARRAASWSRRWPPTRARSASPPATTPTGSSPTSSSAARRWLSAVRLADPGGLLGRGRRRWPRGGRRNPRRAGRASTRRCWDRRRCSGCAAGPAASWSIKATRAGRRSTPWGAPWTASRRAPPGAARGQRRRRSAVIGRDGRPRAPARN